jgi:hypothetical protein
MRGAAKAVLAMAVVVAGCSTARPRNPSLSIQPVRSAATSVRRQSAIITGTVVDSLTGLALRGVTVALVAPSGTTRQRTSDVAGHVRFDSLTPGIYVASATHRLLDSARVSFRVLAGDSVLLTLATRGRVAPPLLSSERNAQLAAIDSARTRWLRVRPYAYKFQVRLECFCFPGPPGPVIEVVGTTVTSIAYNGVRRQIAADSSRVYDITGIFDYMASVVRDGRYVLRDVTYEPRLGYPATFTTESSQVVTDTWVHHFVEHFEAGVPERP